MCAAKIPMTFYNASIDFKKKFEEETGLRLVISLADGNCFLNSLDCSNPTIKKKLDKHYCRRGSMGEAEIFQIANELNIYFVVFRLQQQFEDVFYPGIQAEIIKRNEKEKENVMEERRSDSASDTYFENFYATIYGPDNSSLSDICSLRYFFPLFYHNYPDEQWIGHFDGLHCVSPQLFRKFWSKVRTIFQKGTEYSPQEVSQNWEIQNWCWKKNDKDEKDRIFVNLSKIKFKEIVMMTRLGFSNYMIEDFIVCFLWKNFSSELLELEAPCFENFQKFAKSILQLLHLKYEKEFKFQGDCFKRSFPKSLNDFLGLFDGGDILDLFKNSTILQTPKSQTSSGSNSSGSSKKANSDTTRDIDNNNNDDDDDDSIPCSKTPPLQSLSSSSSLALPSPPPLSCSPPSSSPSEVSSQTTQTQSQPFLHALPPHTQVHPFERGVPRSPDSDTASDDETQLCDLKKPQKKGVYPTIQHTATQQYNTTTFILLTQHTTTKHIEHTKHTNKHKEKDSSSSNIHSEAKGGEEKKEQTKKSNVNDEVVKERIKLLHQKKLCKTIVGSSKDFPKKEGKTKTEKVFINRFYTSTTQQFYQLIDNNYFILEWIKMEERVSLGKGEVLGTSISAEEEESGGRGGGEVSGATNNQRKDLLYKDEDKNIVLPEDDVNDHTKWGGDRKYSVDNLYHLKKKEDEKYYVKKPKSGAGNYITIEKIACCRFCNLFVPQRSTKKVQIAHLILAHPAAYCKHLVDLCRKKTDDKGQSGDDQNVGPDFQRSLLDLGLSKEEATYFFLINSETSPECKQIFDHVCSLYMNKKKDATTATKKATATTTMEEATPPKKKITKVNSTTTKKATATTTTEEATPPKKVKKKVTPTTTKKATATTTTEEATPPKKVKKKVTPTTTKKATATTTTEEATPPKKKITKVNSTTTKKATATTTTKKPSIQNKKVPASSSPSPAVPEKETETEKKRKRKRQKEKKEKKEEEEEEEEEVQGPKKLRTKKRRIVDYEDEEDDFDD